MAAKTYCQTFYRCCFASKPPTEQTADVILSTDIPYDDEHLPQFEAALWDAAFKQNPQWRDATGGWSSVMTRGPIRKVEVDRLEINQRKQG